uniref:RNase H domain-containing protein n=1 Tax=Strongyloides venezuelensis TaxID=75913 RepID=A0A0K0F402_STRVS
MYNSILYSKHFNSLKKFVVVLQNNIRFVKFSTISYCDTTLRKESPLNHVEISVLNYNTNLRWEKGKYVVNWPSYCQYNAIGNGLHTKKYHSENHRYYLSGLIYVMIRAIYNLKLDNIRIVTDSRYLKHIIDKKLDFHEKNNFVQYRDGVKEKKRNGDLFKIICMLRKKIELSCVVEDLVDEMGRNKPTMDVVKYYNNTKLDEEEAIKRYENLVEGKRNLWHYLDCGNIVSSKKSYPIFDEPHFKAELKSASNHAPLYYVGGVLVDKNDKEYLAKFVFQSFKDRICVTETVSQSQLNITLVKLIGIINCLEYLINLGKREAIIVHDLQFFSYGMRHGWYNMNGEEIGYKDYYLEIVELLSKINVDFIYYDIINSTPSFSFFKSLSAAFYGDDFDMISYE